MSPPGYPSAWLHPCRARFCFTRQSHYIAGAHDGSRPAFLPLLARLLQLAIPRRMDLHLSPVLHICRRDKSDGTVQAHGIVVLHVLLDQLLTILFGQRGARPYAFSFERFVPPFDLTVRLR